MVGWGWGGRNKRQIKDIRLRVKYEEDGTKEGARTEARPISQHI